MCQNYWPHVWSAQVLENNWRSNQNRKGMKMKCHQMFFLLLCFLTEYICTHHTLEQTDGQHIGKHKNLTYWSNRLTLVKIREISEKVFIDKKNIISNALKRIIENYITSALYLKHESIHSSSCHVTIWYTMALAMHSLIVFFRNIKTVKQQLAWRPNGELEFILPLTRYVGS